MKILLLRLRLIGDVVFTTPLVRALKRTYPDAHLSYLVEQEAAPVLAGNPHIDELIVVRKSRGLQRLREDWHLARRLRRARYDIAIDLHGGPRTSWLCRATGAPQRIGYDIAGRSRLYTRVIHRPRGLHPRHSVLNQWDLLAGIEGWPEAAADPARDAVEMAPEPASERRVAERLAAAGVTASDELVLVHVSAGNPFRRWPEPSFVELVTHLARGGERRRIILSSGPSDREAAGRIIAEATALLGPAIAPRVIDFGEFDLPELRALVARSRLFVGGDTGPLHVAATTVTPIVGIYGPTLEQRSAPWRDRSIPTAAVHVDGLPCRPCDQRRCEPGDFRCLTSLPPAAVIAAADHILERKAS